MNIQKKIRDLREDNDLTQAQLAEIFGTSQRRISRIERHDTEITPEEIRQYAIFFKVSADWLLDLDQ